MPAQRDTVPADSRCLTRSVAYRTVPGLIRIRTGPIQSWCSCQSYASAGCTIVMPPPLRRGH